MRKLLYAAMAALPLLAAFSCSDNDGPEINPEEQERLDSIRRADSIAAVEKAFNDSMLNVKEVSLPILEYGINVGDLLAKEQRTLLQDSSWTINGNLGGDDWSMTRRELDYAVTDPKAVSFQVMYLIDETESMSEAYMAVWRDRGKQLYDFMRWGFISMGSDKGKDYFLSKDSTDFIYIRDMYTINPTYDYYFINFRETSPEEIEYFYGAPAKKAPVLDPRLMKAEREMMFRMAARIR